MMQRSPSPLFLGGGFAVQAILGFKEWGALVGEKQAKY